GARLVTAAGVADQRGVVADDEDGLVAEFLKQAQLTQGDGVAEVDVDAGGVDAVLDAEGLAGLDAAFEILPQIGLRHDLLGAAADQGQLLLDALHGKPSRGFTTKAQRAQRRQEQQEGRTVPSLALCVFSSPLSSLCPLCLCGEPFFTNTS